MKDNKKNNKLIITLMVIVLILVSVTIFILNYSFNNTSLTILEKKWISDNSTSMLDVNTYNDIPLYGENGNGIIFDFLNRFTEEYSIAFNRISYITSSDTQYRDIAFKVIPGTARLASNDILMYTDYYSLLSNDDKIIKNIRDINNYKIGIMKNDNERIKYHLGDQVNDYIEYDNVEDLVKALSGDSIEYIILPTNQYIGEIAKNDLYINYKFASLNNKYILTVNDDTLYSIFNKFYINYTDKYFDEDYSREFLNTYFDSLDVTDVNRENYNSKIYNFGYVTDMPYIEGNGDTVNGIIAKYLDNFEKIANVEFSYNEYYKIENLNKDIGTDKIDISYNSDLVTIDKDNTSIVLADIPTNRKYVVLSKEYFSADSIQGLNNYDNVYTIKDSYLDMLAKKYNIVTKSFSNSDQLLRNINEESIVLIDYNTYKYYQDKKFNDFKVIYTDTINVTYNFTLNNKDGNKTFNGLFKTYLSLVDFNDVALEYNNSVSSVTLEQIKNVSKYLLILFSVLFVFLLISFILLNKKKKQKLVNHNDKLKYIDMLTSLKNRNYLNNNMKKWSNNRIYPKAVIVVDLNNIKYINDNYGHEEGDNVIKKAANILIVNQLENTDIMRTDGNEFLIYLLGYNEKQIVAYCHKIFKDLKNLPHGFGATLGHSMILDDVKSVEDAINEANIEMREAKEKMK